jgi:hypothetical protein
MCLSLSLLSSPFLSNLYLCFFFIYGFAQLGDYLSLLLVEALRLEEDTENRQQLIFLCVLFAFDNIHLSKDFSHSFISLLLDKMVRIPRSWTLPEIGIIELYVVYFSQSTWNVETTVPAVHALSCMSLIYHLIRKDVDVSSLSFCV